MNKDYIQYNKYYLQKFGSLPEGNKPSIEYFKDNYKGIRHRINGPAFVHPNERSYWRDGNMHRLNAPAFFHQRFEKNNKNKLVLSHIELCWYEFGIRLNYQNKYL
jgi:hypothetical protein